MAQAYKDASGKTPLSAKLLTVPNSALRKVEIAATELFWSPGTTAAAFTPAAIAACAARPRTTAFVLRDPDSGAIGVGLDGSVSLDPVPRAPSPVPQVIGMLPPLYPEWLGNRGFAEIHGTRFAYIGGAMANGIATTRMVIELARTGCLGFFGAAGLSLARIEKAIDELQAALDPAGLPWGVNLIHSPAEPAHEEAVAELLLRRGVRCVEASAYLRLTQAVVRYACSGLTRAADGSVVRRNRVIAKISRSEVARQFLNPAPSALLQKLVERGQLTPLEAELAATIPLAEDLTCESDSGGHTDNRPLAVLIPEIAGLRTRIVAERGYRCAIRIGAAGGLGTPAAVAAAFALGADYVQTGSVNQACVESGLSAVARAQLAQADMADVAMAPAADMFEMGVDVQVLRRGTLFAPRARKLYELYRAHPSLDAIPAEDREKVESGMLRASFDEAWASTHTFWMGRDPKQVERAERDPKHKMALVFRGYLGLASRWAIDGVAERASDYQIWCGPAMGAFNTWAKGSFLEDPEQRTVAQVARNLLEGAAVVTRAQQLRSYGAPVPAEAFDYRPRALG
ncbi:MAG: PfaD family polyunsaturated fatty acid/polyketide biosynthesis protein [Rhodanobacteraceae bacterium]|nr:PfaD family polyunsaturated fatty acid/polyketide biosynthesis protein [Rhodanobacteraceae bacterium]